MKLSPSIALFLLSFLFFLGASESAMAFPTTAGLTQSGDAPEENDPETLSTTEWTCGPTSRHIPPVRRQSRPRKPRSFSVFAATVLFSFGILSCWNVRPPDKPDDPDWTSRSQPNRFVFLSAHGLRAPPVLCA